MSRKVTSVLLVSLVNLIVWCNWFNSFMRDSSFSLGWVHTIKMSSIYRLYIRGFKVCFSKKGRSSASMNILA